MVDNQKSQTSSTQKGPRSVDDIRSMLDEIHTAAATSFKDWLENYDVAQDETPSLVMPQNVTDEAIYATLGLTMGIMNTQKIIAELLLDIREMLRLDDGSIKWGPKL